MERGQAAPAAPPPQPGQTAVGTQRPQKRFFRKGRPTASTPNKPRDWPTLSHPPRPFPLGRGALHCPWGLAGRMCAFGFFLPSADRLGSLQGRQGPGLRPSPGRPVSSLRCGPRQPPLRPLTPFPLEKRSGSATAARRGRFRGLTYPTSPQDRKTRCRPVSAPLNERMTGQGRNAATAGWCGPQPGTGEDSGQTGRTLDAAAAARASRRGSRGGLLTPAPRRLAGESGRAEGSALCPSPQGAEQVAPKASLTRVASARSGARCRSGEAVRYENRLHIVSVLCIISVLI